MKETLGVPLVDSQHRSSLFLLLVFIVNAVMDGLLQVTDSFHIQILLLPFTIIFLAASYFFLSSTPHRPAKFDVASSRLSEPYIQGRVIVLLEGLFVALFVYQTWHFAGLGYRLHGLQVGITFALVLVAVTLAAVAYRRLAAWVLLAIYLVAYVAGQVLSIFNFPLVYLRSDMLPVVFWADRALLAGQNPYQHFHVAERIYDFPYLPGTLLAYAPAQAMRIDLRWASIFYVAGGMCLLFAATRPAYRKHVAALAGVYVLCPYLQYRHELYTQAHFFSLILTFVLLQRRFYAWSAAVFGVSMVISQFSWVIFPFFLLYALRRRGWGEVCRLAAISGGCALILLLPFLHSGAGSIAHNAVGQWDRLQRPIARPMNLSFWVTYLVRPNQLKWVQLLVLSGGFLYCWVRGRCATLVDTLRWMIWALLIFILLNVLVDGYFYLMLLIPMLVYTCVANGWWSDGEEPALA